MAKVPALLLAAAVIVGACRGAPAGSVTESEMREVATKALDEHAEAALRRDVALAASLFTDDVVLMFPNAQNVQGHDSVVALMARSWPIINPKQIRYATEDVFVFGDTAVTTARYWLTLEPRGQAAMQDSGRYFFIWTRYNDGGWKVFRAIANSLMPPNLP